MSARLRIPLESELRSENETRSSLRYPDSGSGARRDGSFWHPRSGDGFRPLGSIVIAGYDDPNGRRASVVVKDGGNAAVAAPTGYDWIWDDSGSGADWDGSVWRPRAPAGYVNVGDVAVSNHDQPSVDDVWCVRADLVTDGTIIDPSVSRASCTSPTRRSRHTPAAS
jgi:hypothetical protein